jgi:hypothetical protein
MKWSRVMTNVESRFPRVSDTRLVARPNFAARVNSVAAAVLQAVETIPQGCLQPVESPSAPLAYQPRTLLALLTYAYALGIYASADIERMMRRDANFRELSGNEFAGWRMLKHFRRANLDSIRTCLERTLQNISNGTRNQIVSSGVLRSDGTRAADESWDSERIAAEVNERLERAIWMDSMALDYE